MMHKGKNGEVINAVIIKLKMYSYAKRTHLLLTKT
jgi:hypothetical protein